MSVTGVVPVRVMRDFITGHIEAQVSDLVSGRLLMNLTATGSYVHAEMLDGSTYLIPGQTKVLRTPAQDGRDQLSCKLKACGPMDLCKQFDLIIFEDEKSRRIVFEQG